MSSFTSKTILAASQPRSQQTQHRSAPRPKHQRDEKALERAQVQEEIDAAEERAICYEVKRGKCKQIWNKPKNLQTPMPNLTPKPTKHKSHVL
jgi:hypothetical protein